MKPEIYEIVANGGGETAGLDRLILSIGKREFPDILSASLHRILGVDHCMVFSFPPGRRPENLLCVGTIEHRLAMGLGDSYVGEYHVADPNKPLIFAHSDRSQPILLRFAEERKYRRDYMKRFFRDSGICDKFAIAVWQDGTCYYTNFYRLNPSGSLGDRDYGRLIRSGPVFAAAVARHFSEYVTRSETLEDLEPVLELFFQETAPFSLLSPRERDICVGILMGKTSEALALQLEISVNSVLSYRKRSYARLGITSQNELFTLFIRRWGNSHHTAGGRNILGQLTARSSSFQ